MPDRSANRGALLSARWRPRASAPGPQYWRARGQRPSCPRSTASEPSSEPGQPSEIPTLPLQ